MNDHNHPPKSSVEPDPRIPAYLREYLNELVTTIDASASLVDGLENIQTTDPIILSQAELNDLVASAKKEILTEIIGVIMLHNGLHELD